MKQGTLTLELLVEEPSAERALRELLPRIVPEVSFKIRPFRGKTKLLGELPQRLAGYANRMRWEALKVVVLVHRDDDDCRELKRRMDEQASVAGLRTAGTSPSSFDVLNRIVVEELEAWFFGDVPALRSAYPRLPASLDTKAAYRDPDSIAGGTCEALERVMQRHGYYRPGLAKYECAGSVARHMDVERNRSRSFQVFRDGLRRLMSEEEHAQAD